MLKHGFNFTASAGTYKYAKVIGIKKDNNPISIERGTIIDRYIFTSKFITNSSTQELKFSVILNSQNGNINYKILTNDLPSNLYLHLPIVVATDDGCDIYLSTLLENGFANIELDDGNANNIVLYPVGQATISESDALALENQATPSFQKIRIQSQTPTTIETDYGNFLILDLKNGVTMIKFIGNANTTTELTELTTLTGDLIPRANLNAITTPLIRVSSTNIGVMRLSTNGKIDAQIVEPYSIGQMYIIH